MGLFDAALIKKNLAGNLIKNPGVSPEQTAQLQQLQSNVLLNTALQQDALKPHNAGPTGAIAKILQAFIAKKNIDRANEKQIEIAKQARLQRIKDIQSFGTALQKGTPVNEAIKSITNPKLAEDLLIMNLKTQNDLNKPSGAMKLYQEEQRMRQQGKSPEEIAKFREFAMRNQTNINIGEKVKIPPGFRPVDGNDKTLRKGVVPITGGPADKNVIAEKERLAARKANIGKVEALKTLRERLDDFEKEIKKSTFKGRLLPGYNKGLLLSKAKQAQIAYKEAANLGAIQKPDLPFIQGSIPDPTALGENASALMSQFLTGDATGQMKGKIAGAREFINKRIKNLGIETEGLRFNRDDRRQKTQAAQQNKGLSSDPNTARKIERNLRKDPYTNPNLNKNDPARSHKYNGYGNNPAKKFKNLQDAPKEMNKRVVGRVYNSRIGPVKWTDKGWVKAK